MDKRMVGFRQRLAQIGRYIERPGRLLDYGCAVGLFVKAAVEAGWSARGYERSSWAASYGRSQFGLDITVADGTVDPFGPNSFDVVTLWDVLEHLEQPRRVLELVSKWLVQGGIVALNTVNSSSLGARLAGSGWRHVYPPHHLQLYSKRSLERLLAEFGFEMMGVQSEGVLFADFRRELTMGRVGAGLESLVRYWRIRPAVTVLNLLDEIEVIAVKR
jgi:SAM-dependent methyltransferase